MKIRCSKCGTINEADRYADYCICDECGAKLAIPKQKPRYDEYDDDYEYERRQRAQAPARREEVDEGSVGAGVCLALFLNVLGLIIVCMIGKRKTSRAAGITMLIESGIAATIMLFIFVLLPMMGSAFI